LGKIPHKQHTIFKNPMAV